MTTGTAFLASLPPRPGPAREHALLDAVAAGAYAPVTWWPLTSAVGDHSLVLYVSADALRIGTADDSIRVNASARTAQQIADMLGCVLPTTRVCDLVWEQATVRAAPCIGGAGRDMADTSRMLAHHVCVEGKVQGQSGLTETVGKNWVVTSQLAVHAGRAANYGWFDPRAPYHSGPGGRGPHRVWQPLGLAHDLDHVDYSQIVRLVYRACVLDGQARDVVDVMRDHALAPLLSDEGPLRFARLPGVAPVVRRVA